MSQMSLLHILTSYSFLIQFNINLTFHLHPGHQSYLFTSDFPTDLSINNRTLGGNKQHKNSECKPEHNCKTNGSLKPLKPSGNYIYHRLLQLVTLYFVYMDLVRLLVKTAIISLNSVNQLIFVMVKCGVFFEVGTEFLNII
jgi:hypothetical protein